MKLLRLLALAAGGAGVIFSGGVAPGATMNGKAETAQCVGGACAAPSMATNMKAKLPLKTVAHVDLKRYVGDWRVIANVPYFAERGCVDSIEGYRLRPDGRMDNYFTFRKGSFDAPQKQIHALATVYNHETNAEWRVRFFGLINAKYFITDLDPQYRWTVVAHPSRKYGWIMARERTMPEATYQGILRRLEAQGYQASQFQKVPQLPSQMPAK